MTARSPKRSSPMRHDFSKVPQANISRSSFNRSFGVKTTFDAGPIVPLFEPIEVLPGDTHRMNATVFARLATPLHPIMDNLHAETFYFFVPNRLVWENWVKFMGEQTDPGDSTDFTIPVITGDSIATGDLGDYFGLPIGLDATVTTDVSSLPFRMMAKIWNEWFRDENLQDSWHEITGNGPDTLHDVDNGSNRVPAQPFSRGKRHDYFTSCLPWPQKGPGVDLPLGTVAPIIGLGVSDTAPNIAAADVRETEASATRVYANAWNTVNNNILIEEDLTTGATNDYPGVYADLSSATAATINDLRQAFAIQKLQERDARGGTRYQELVLAHFGVRGGDARLNRSEYLGGGSHAVGINTVPQTSEDGATPQGHLTAYGTVSGQSGFTKSFVEHGYIFGFINVRADLTYQQGLSKHWTRSTKYDYFWPALQSVGEQAVLNKELWHNAAGTDNEDIFGYQERFAEYRYQKSQITGLFRSDAAPGATLDPWHLSEDFAALPPLDATFITSAPPVDRVIAVPAEPHFLLDAFFNYTATRPMPVNGTPGYIDHF